MSPPPFYEFKCNKCNKTFTEYLEMNYDESTVTCHYCHSHDIRRVYSSVNLLFRGGGFYETDYKKSNNNSKTNSK